MKRVQSFLRYLRTWFPSSLPLGIQEFDHFADSVIFSYNLPDLPSYRHAIASMIMHLGPTTAHKSKRFFAISVKKAMANQIAFEKIQQLKKLEEEYLKSKLHEPKPEEKTLDAIPQQKQA